MKIDILVECIITDYLFSLCLPITAMVVPKLKTFKHIWASKGHSKFYEKG